MDIMIKKTNTSKRGGEEINSAEEFKSDVKQLLAIIEGINKSLEDEDTLKYVNVLRDQYVSNLYKLGFALGEYGEYLEKVPEAYTMLDESFASQNIDV